MFFPCNHLNSSILWVSPKDFIIFVGIRSLTMSEKLKINIEDLLGEEIRDIPYGTGRVQTVSGKIYFLKHGASSPTYQCEANGLNELMKARVRGLGIAKVMGTGEHFLLTEYITPGRADINFFEEFGRNLARLHRFEGKEYGFYEDNFIGANPQLNLAIGEEKADWLTFFFNKRLLFQYQLAERNGFVSDRLRHDFNLLEKMLPNLLEGSIEPSVLLHGDLWSGNFLCDITGRATLIDPAVYYGHREADLAMTRLFGGFPADFYRAYHKEYPLKEGWMRREPIYKLYHVLNHLNIFGRTYLSEAEHLISLSIAGSN